MKKCIVCGKELTFYSKYLIRSREMDNHFYSKECVKKFVEDPDKYLDPVYLNYGSYKIGNETK